MGRADGPGLKGQADAPGPSPAGSPLDEVVACRAGSVEVPSDLPTVRTMGTDEYAPMITLDTEFTYVGDGSRVIDSYQLSCIDPEDDGLLVQVTLTPPLGSRERLALGDCVAVVLRESGLWRAVGLPDPRGVARRDFWVPGDHGASVDALYKGHRVSLVLAGHYLNADLTAFARPVRRRGDGRWEDILHRVTSASGGLVGLRPVRMPVRSGARGDGDRWLPLSLIVRDSMGHAPDGASSLAALGEICGVPKVEVPEDAIKDMTSYRLHHLEDFLGYGAQDTVVVLEWLGRLWGDGVVPPVTVSGGGARALRDGIMRYWGIEGNALFRARFQGLVSVDAGQEASDDGHSYYAVRLLTPVDGDANQTHSAFKQAFHGGWNTALKIGVFPGRTYDHDVRSAYPTAMASVVDVDYEGGCIEEVVKDRALTLSDFPLGPVTPLVAYASWSFPEGVEPCLPVQVGQSIIYPRASEGVGALQGEAMEGSGYSGFDGAWVCGPELYLALQLGARVDVQIGYRLRVLEHEGGPSRAMRSAVRQMVLDRAVAKAIWGEGAVVELLIKLATNSCYGKLAQDVAERSGWDAWAEEMESIGGSAVTSPYHAAMITSLVRALLLGVANGVPLISVTTDGYITTTEDVEDVDAYGIADVFRDSREALTGDRTLWEVKHWEDDLVNLTTRANVSLRVGDGDKDKGGVIAKGGLKTPKGIARGSLEERAWFLEKAISREGKIINKYTSFPSFRELSRSVDRVDFHSVERAPEVSLDFDMKRRPLMGTLRVDVAEGYEVAGLDTAPWDTVAQYQRAREIARHIASVRPGTTGEDRPTGCLRTRAEWETWAWRFEASGRRIRTADAALLTELVAAHKAGLVEVPVLSSRVPVEQKLTWLSGLGYGDFTRAQWDHLGKRDRRARVVRSLDLDRLTDLLESLPEW